MIFSRVSRHMSIFTRLGLAALFAAFLLSAPLHAHEGHQDNMSEFLNLLNTLTRKKFQM